MTCPSVCPSLCLPSRRSAEDVKLSIGDEVSERAAREIVARLKALGIETGAAPGNP